MLTRKPYSSIIEYFRTLKKAQQLCSAYLFVGNNPDSDFFVAREVVKLKYCQASAYPCTGCPSCGPSSGEVNYDVHILMEEVIKIEHVRRIQEFLRLRSLSEAGKSVLIRSIENMTEEAANAFLKTLEEPPSTCLILATTARKDAVLPTINSRCKKIYLPFFDRDHDQASQLDPAMIKTLFTQGCTALKEKDRKTMVFLVRWLISFYRDVLVWSLTGNKQNLIDQRNYEIIFAYASSVAPAQAQAILEHLFVLQNDLGTININLAKNIINTLLWQKSS